ncbi:hypothetical protein CBW56_01530 [Denitratisoma oestradiolicum]|nr:hypothetical protein CBW56_01530 [Denitratisoma oestradiolicum]
MCRGQACSDERAGILLRACWMAKMRGGANTERLARHNGRQPQLAGRAGAGALAINDLAVMDIAGFAGQRIMRPLQWNL